MFINAITWRYIVGALVTGLILNIAGIINFWIFLSLVAMAITIALAQYLPVARRTVTVILILGTIAAIGIPTVHGFINGHWPLTAKALQKQNRASDLKGYEAINQPGLMGIAGMRKLAEQKEQTLTAYALSWFERAAELHADGKFAEAKAAEEKGRKNLDLAIEAREADAQYIKDKLSKVKVPAGLWQKTKDFFTDLDFAATATWIKGQGFSTRLFLLGAVLLLLGVLLFRRLSKGFSGVAVFAGSVAIVWALWLLFTPELAPNPASLTPPSARAATSATSARLTKTFNVPARQTVATGIFLKAGQIARFHQPSPKLYYLKGDRHDVAVRAEDWTDQWKAAGQIGLRGGPQPTTVTVAIDG